MNQSMVAGLLAGLLVCSPASAGRARGYQTYGPFTATSATM